jgi:site-specific recombinase XerD
VDVANGDAAADTLRGYRTQVGVWVRWCQKQGLSPARATTADVKGYRQALVSEAYKPASIAHKLTVLRRFYQAAVYAGLRADNPVSGVRPPRNKQALEDLRYLSEGELTRLLRTVPQTTAVKALRDRALLAVLGLHGLRAVEIQRANVEDLKADETPALLVRGKNRDRVVYLRPDVAQALVAFLQARGPVPPDRAGTPLFTAVGNRAGGRRLSRRGCRHVVDSYLRQAALKRPGVSNHALRHTAATLAYKHTRDLRAVQEMLGHTDPKTTGRYAHVVDRAQNNPAVAVPVHL